MTTLLRARRPAKPDEPTEAAKAAKPGRAAKAAKPPRVRSSASRTLTWALAMLAVVAVWVVFYALVLSGLQEAHAQHNAYAQFREQLAMQTAPVGGVIKPDAPVALLDAPQLGLRDTVVVEGTAAGDLERGPGHRRDTVLPGQPGISVVYGRATLFGAPFADITAARAGGHIDVTTGQGKFTYVVEGVRHVGDHYPQPLAPGAGRLTLVTSEGASAGNLWQPQRPVYVDALLQGKSQPVPSGRLTSVPKAETAMSTDQGSLFQLVLWLPLVVLAALAVVWALVRWGRWQAWLIGIPTLIAAFWGASETAVQLLPNLM